jgi:5'-nucleotidase
MSGMGKRARRRAWRVVLVLGAAALLVLPGWGTAHAADTIDVQILGFNDFHGQLDQPTGNVGGQAAGGIEYFATAIKTMRAQNPNTVVVSAGDLFGASPLLSGLFHDEPTIEAMNQLGLDFEGVGNHDFDEGIPELHRMQDGGCHPVDGCQDGDGFAGASFEFLAANVRNATTHETVFPPYGIKEFGGVKIAFIGVTLKGTPEIVSPKAIAGYEFLDEADTVNALVPVLQAQGIHTIIVLLHQSAGSTGSGQQGFNGCNSTGNALVARFDPEIDAVFSGHSHTAYNCVYNGRPVTQALSQGKLITQLNMTISTATDQPVSMVANNRIVARTVTPDPDALTLLAKYRAIATPISNKVQGTITQDILRGGGASSAGEQPLGDVIADSHLWGAQSEGAQIAFMNTGGIRQDLLFNQISGGEQPGEVTYGELFTVQPFGNALETITLTGKQIEQVLEQQFTGGNGILQISKGFTYTQDRFRPAGDRIDPDTIRLNGVKLDPNATYRVTGNSFLMDGGDGYTVFAQGTDRTGGQVDNDATSAYFKLFSPIDKPALNRITRVDSAAAVDLGVSVSAPAATYGTNVTHTLNVVNDGPAAAAGVGLTYVLPAALTFVSASGGGTYDPATRTVSWTLGSLDAKAAAAPTVTLTPVAAGPASTTATLTTSSSDAQSANNADIEAFTIAKAPLTVTADSKSRLFGASNPPLTATLTGFVLGQSPATSDVTGAASCSTAAIATSSGGDYPVTCTSGTLASANYDFTAFVPGTLTVTYSRPCLTGIGAGGLTVGPGQAMCVAAGAIQSGPVVVAPGGSLDLQGGMVTGPVRAAGAGVVRVCGVLVTGQLTVSGSTGLVLIGGDAATGPCASNTIVGPVQVTGNTAGVEINGNSISGPLTVTGNTGAVPPPDTGPVHVSGNAVVGPVRVQS